MTIHAEYPTPKGDEMNALDDLREYIDKRGEQLIALGNGNYVPDEAMPAILERIEREYMERPKDADGMPIEIGDTVGCEQRYTHVGGEDVVQATGKVEELVLSGKGWEVDIDSYDEIVPASCVHHTKPDSWEQIEADAGEWYSADYWHKRGKQTDDGPVMERDMRLDLVRRAKALSERGA